MVLSRTLICSKIWKYLWENIIGEWGIFTLEGTFNTEGILNVFYSSRLFILDYMNLINRINQIDGLL